MIVSDKIIALKCLGTLFKNSERSFAKAGKNSIANVSKNRGRALEIGPKTGSAGISENPKSTLSTISVVTSFYLTGIGLYLGIFV